MATSRFLLGRNLTVYLQIRCGQQEAGRTEENVKRRFRLDPTLADLRPPAPLANARRFGVNAAALLRLLQAETAAKAIKAFADAAPERRADAE
jgi:hypothetical protein